MTPLLSICIPTYNHAELLDRALARLTSLPAFASGDVEVVLSDNASTDGTRAVGERYAAAFPGRVNYFRNPENVFDRNYELALSHGRGLFLKLANDTLFFSDEGLAALLAAVRRHRDAKPVLFFSNLGGEPSEVACDSFDSLFDEISYHSTWIGSFGIWKVDFDALLDFARMRALLLTQVDVLCRMMSKKMSAVVVRTKFCESLPRKVIGGYNLAQVFGRNYFGILRAYVVTGEFSRRAFRRERFRMLRYHILPFYLSLSPKHAFPKSGYLRYLARDYWCSPFYWCTVPFVCVAACMKQLFARQPGSRT